MKKITNFGALLVAASLSSTICAQIEVERLGEANDTTLLNDVEEGRGRTVQLSDKWIGVLCRPVDEVLRVHLNIDQGVGLVVERVVPDSPASRAGLKTHDILMQVNDQDLDSLQVLIDATAKADQHGITLRRIRGGERDLVTVIPEPRPETVGRFGGALEGGEPPDMGRLRAWVEKLERGEDGLGEDSLRFRFFGPGVPLEGNEFPSGISIQIERENDQPARIKVKKGDTTWEVTEDSLDELPEDVRDTVQGMLRGGAGFRMPMPGIENIPWPQFDRRLDNMNDQLERMMDELRKLRRERQEDDDSIDA
jgi:hypothetical protein